MAFTSILCQRLRVYELNCQRNLFGNCRFSEAFNRITLKRKDRPRKNKLDKKFPKDTKIGISNLFIFPLMPTETVFVTGSHQNSMPDVNIFIATINFKYEESVEEFRIRKNFRVRGSVEPPLFNSGMARSIKLVEDTVRFQSTVA
jgi:hypothetical protein